MDRPWRFLTDAHADAFCREIAGEMVRLFGITEGEAVGRINRGWGHLHEFLPLAIHETPAYWASHMYFGADSFWWVGEDTRERLGLGPLVPQPYP